MTKGHRGDSSTNHLSPFEFMMSFRTRRPCCAHENSGRNATKLSINEGVVTDNDDDKMRKPLRFRMSNTVGSPKRSSLGMQYSILLVLCVGVFVRFSKLGAMSGEALSEVAGRYLGDGLKGELLFSNPKHSSMGYFRSDDSLALYPGEMPGYTGHARPQATLASHFRVVDERGEPLRNPSSLLVVDVSKPWSARVRCFDCGDVNPQFYMRAYGPTVHAGHVHHERIRDSGERMWRLELPPLVDAGTYYVEAILAFSHVPPISRYPHENGKQGEPPYEGYALANFPMIINAIDEGYQWGLRRASKAEDADDDDDNIIALKDMVIKDLEHSYDEFGRWKVVERNTLIPKENATRTMDFDGYRDGTNSLGVKFQYMPRNGKELVSTREHYDKLNAMLDNSDKYYSIISLGDSNIRLMNDALGRVRNEEELHTFLHYRLPTNNGLHETLSEIKDRLYNEILNPKFENIILFNVGMHEINENCAHNNLDRRKARGIDDANFNCLEQYRKDLATFIDMLLEIPHTRKLIFQTTTASWPKHGNYGFAWPAAEPTHGPQLYTKSSNFVEAFNTEALNVIFNNERYRNAIDVVDGFWCTLSRPDSREVETYSQVLTNHLVHGGTEIYKLFTSEYLTILYNVAKEDVTSLKKRGGTSEKVKFSPKPSRADQEAAPGESEEKSGISPERQATIESGAVPEKDIAPSKNAVVPP